MQCRAGCGACCTAISISSPIPGLPDGKPAGVRCPHLTPQNLCGLFGKPERPAICVSYKATPDFCGKDAAEAARIIAHMETLTAP